MLVDTDISLNRYSFSKEEYNKIIEIINKLWADLNNRISQEGIDNLTFDTANDFFRVIFKLPTSLSRPIICSKYGMRTINVENNTIEISTAEYINEKFKAIYDIFKDDLIRKKFINKVCSLILTTQKRIDKPTFTYITQIIVGNRWSNEVGFISNLTDENLSYLFEAAIVYNDKSFIFSLLSNNNINDNQKKNIIKNVKATATQKANFIVSAFPEFFRDVAMYFNGFIKSIDNLRLFSPIIDDDTLIKIFMKIKTFRNPINFKEEKVFNYFCKIIDKDPANFPHIKLLLETL